MSDKKLLDDMDDDLGLEIEDDVLEDEDELGLSEDDNPENWDEEEDEDSLSVDDEEEDSEDDDEDDEEEDEEDEDEDEDDQEVAQPKSDKKGLIILGVGGLVLLGGGGYMGMNLFMKPQPAPAPSKIAPKPVAKQPAPVQQSIEKASSAAPIAVTAPKAQVVEGVKPAAPSLNPVQTPVVKKAPSGLPLMSEENTAKKIADLTKKVDDLGKLLTKVVSDVNSSKPEAEKQTAEINELKKELRTSNDKINALRANISKMESEVKKGVDSKEVNSLKVKLASLSGKTSRMEAKFNSEINKLAKANESTIQEAATLVGDLQQKVEDVANNKRVFVQADEKDIPYELNGEKRAIGFNVINATPDENMSVMMTPSRNVIVVFLGEKVIIDGKSRKVTKIEDGGWIVHFEGGYFADGNRMEKPPASVVKAQAKKVTAKKKAKAEEAKPVERKLNNKVKLAMVIGNDKYVVKTKEGLFIKVSKGEVIPGYESFGKIGEFITDGAQGVNGVLLIGKETFIGAN